jgi:hypothetical protein
MSSRLPIEELFPEEEEFEALQPDPEEDWSEFTDQDGKTYDDQSEVKEDTALTSALAAADELLGEDSDPSEVPDAPTEDDALTSLFAEADELIGDKAGDKWKQDKFSDAPWKKQQVKEAPEAVVAPEPVEEESDWGEVASDMAYKVAGAAVGGVEGISRTVDTYSFGDNRDGIITNTIGDAADYLHDQVSDNQKKADAKKFFSDKEGETFGDAWSDPRAWGGLGAEGVGSLIPMVAGGIAMGTAKVATLGMGVLSTAMVQGGVGGDLQDSVNSMPQDILDTSPMYKKHLEAHKKEGMDDAKAAKQAREDVSMEISKLGMDVVALPSLLLGTWGASYVNKALFSSVKAGALEGVLTEGVSEGGQGATEQLVKNFAFTKADKNQDAYEGVLESGFREGAGGAFVGGGLSALQNNEDLGGTPPPTMPDDHLSQDGTPPSDTPPSTPPNPTGGRDDLNRSLRERGGGEFGMQDKQEGSDSGITNVNADGVIQDDGMNLDPAPNDVIDPSLEQRDNPMTLNESETQLAERLAIEEQKELAYKEHQFSGGSRESLEGWTAEQEQADQEAYDRYLVSGVLEDYQTLDGEEQDQTFNEDPLHRDPNTRLLKETQAQLDRNKIEPKPQNQPSTGTQLGDNLKALLQERDTADKALTELNAVADSLLESDNVNHQAYGKWVKSAIENSEFTQASLDKAVEHAADVLNGFGSENGIQYAKLGKEGMTFITKAKAESDPRGHGLHFELDGQKITLIPNSSNTQWSMKGADGRLVPVGKTREEAVLAAKAKSIFDGVSRPSHFEEETGQLSIFETADKQEPTLENLPEGTKPNPNNKLEADLFQYQEQTKLPLEVPAPKGKPELTRQEIPTPKLEVEPTPKKEVKTEAEPEKVTPDDSTYDEINQEDHPANIENAEDFLSSKGQEGTESRSTTEEVTDAVSKTFGSKIAKSIEEGSTVVVQTVEDLKTALTDNGSTRDTNQVEDSTEGLYDDETKILYLVADNLDSENLNSVMLHETLHKALDEDANLREKLDSSEAAMREVFDAAEAGKFTGKDAKLHQEAMDRVNEADTSPEHRFEEFQAYLVSVYNETPTKLSGKLQKAVKDMYANIRMALMARGVNIKNLSAADLNAVAVRYLKNKNSVAQGTGSDTYQGNNPQEREEWLASKAKGLDMSMTARMARAVEMGYDITKRWYHGTTAALDDSNPALINPSNSQYSNGLIFVSSDPEFANYWVSEVATGDSMGNKSPNIVPTYVKAKNTFNYQKEEHLADLREGLLDEMHDPYGELYDRFQRNQESNSPFRDMSRGDTESLLRNPESDPDLHSLIEEKFEAYADAILGGISAGAYSSIERRDVVDVMRGLGYDSLFVRELEDINRKIYADVEWKDFDTQKEAKDFIDNTIQPELDIIRKGLDRQVAQGEVRAETADSWMGEVAPVQGFVDGKFRIRYKGKDATRGALNLAVFSEEQLRSPHAAFDTERAQSNDLLASQGKSVPSGNVTTKPNSDFKFSKSNKDHRKNKGFDGIRDEDMKASEKFGEPSMPSMMELVNKFATDSDFRNGLVRKHQFIKRHIRQGAFDRYDAIRNILGDERSWMLSHLSNIGGQVAEAAMLHGRPKLHSSKGIDLEENSESLAEILEPLGNQLEPFFQWIAGNRAKSMREHNENLKLQAAQLEIGIKDLVQEEKEWMIHGQTEGRREVGVIRKELDAARKEKAALLKEAKIDDGLFTDDEIESMTDGYIYRDNESREDSEARLELYESVRENFEEMHNAIVQIGVETGVISEEDAAIWKDQGYYVPFYRVSEETQASDGFGAQTVSGLANSKAFERLKGSKKNISDPLTNVMMNWTHIINTGLKNQAAQSTLDSAVELGLAQEFKASASDQKDERVVFTRENGIKRYYRMSNDPESALVLDSLTQLQDIEVGGWVMKPLRLAKKLLTFGVTVSPEFKIANLMRDTLMAAATTGASANPYINIRDGSKALRDKRKKGRMIAGGGLFGDSGYIHGADPDATRRVLQKGLKRHIVSDQWLARKLFDQYQDVGAAMENVNRAAEFDRKAGNDPDADLLAANFGARDHLDFSRTGSWKAVRFLAQAIPFLNARLQGLDKMHRAATDPAQVKQFRAVTATYVMASVGLYLLMKDDEEYKKAEQWERDTYHLIRIPDTDVMVRIPRPFEVGSLATMAERMVEQIADDSADPELFFDRMKHIGADTFMLDLSAIQLVKPLLEVVNNRDSFRDRPIESAHMQKLSEAKLKVKHDTSETAILASQGLESVGIDFSPVKVDHLVSGYMGWFGQTLVAGTDIILQAAQGKDTVYSKGAPDWKLEDYPVTGRFIRDADNGRSKYVTEFYKNMQDYEGTVNSIREYRTTHSPESLADAQQLLDENPDAIWKAKVYKKVARNMSTMRKRIKQIKADATMTGAQKKKEIDAIQTQSNQMAMGVVKEVD